MRELVAALRRDADRIRADWRHAATVLADWSGPDAAPGRVAGFLRELPAPARGAVTAGSRETATHFAWCLVDEPDQPVSVWVNEYKRPHRWPSSYANTVHNHRYDFCTRVLAGGYRHERYRVVWRQPAVRLAEATLHQQAEVGPGDLLVVPADSFHRVPTARDGTMTLLVKMRPRFRHSVSFDPATGSTQVHIPIESRFDQLVAALDSE